MGIQQLRIVPSRVKPTDGAKLANGATPPPTIEPLPGWNNRQFAIFLLQTAADIEHALLVQYLYAAYSLPVKKDSVEIIDPRTGNFVTMPDPGDPTKQVRVTTNYWSGRIASIAQEEMGHLLSVQCLLRALGGPIGLDREHFPYRSQLYPFPFALEPLTKSSLARYVVAEMPDPSLVPAGVLTPEGIERIRERAVRDTGGVPVNHVGMLYDKLIEVVDRLSEDDFRQDAIPYQPADPKKEWRANENDNDKYVKVLPIRPLPDGSVTALKDVAKRAIRIIARQGEGITPMSLAGEAADASDNSHFRRFLEIYNQFPDGTDPAFPVANNPNTTVPPMPPWNQASDPESAFQEQKERPGRITNKITLLWAHLFNVRYRILLAELHHYLLLRHDDVDQAAVRDRLVKWSFKEMNGRQTSSIGPLAQMMAKLPQYDFPGFNAGAPFEVPFTFDLPDRGPERWRFHRDLHDGSRDLVTQLSTAFQDAGQAAPAVLAELTKFEDIDDGSGVMPAAGRKDFIDQNKDSPF